MVHIKCKVKIDMTVEIILEEMLMEPKRITFSGPTKFPSSIRREEPANIPEQIPMLKVEAAFEELKKAIKRSNQEYCVIDLEINVINLTYLLMFDCLFGRVLLPRNRAGFNRVEIFGINQGRRFAAWFAQISRAPIKELIFHVPQGGLFKGAGKAELISNAESLTIGPGQCDVTDADLEEFKCLSINIKSQYITVAGIKEHLRKVAQLDENNREKLYREVHCNFPKSYNPADVMKEILPENCQHHVSISNGITTLGGQK